LGTFWALPGGGTYTQVGGSSDFVPNVTDAVAPSDFWKIEEDGILPLQEVSSPLQSSGNPGGGSLRTVDAGTTVSYRPTILGKENHHGIMDTWAKHNIPGYKSRASHNPTVAMTPEPHKIAGNAYRDWLEQKTEKRVGGKVDWQKVSYREIRKLSDRMFNSAGISKVDQGAYYKKFHEYRKSGATKF
jgi:hypothetical protein